MSAKEVRKDLFIHDMIHNNPGLAPYISKYNDPVFMKNRKFDGKVFDIYECAQFACLWDKLDELNPDREKVYPVEGKEREWVYEKRAELKEKYQVMKEQGVKVLFMMDMIVLPIRIGKIYPEIFNENHKIDIQKPKMKEILDVLFNEMFAEFPEIDGIYIRFGETYVGPQFATPYHFGNNPILQPEEEYHMFLIQYLIDKVCKEHEREIYYRSWGFGKFQYDPECYLEISEKVETHDKFYFCIKHTEGDFHRDFHFNQSLNIGSHKQVIEVQAAREYEGKGSYPNYIGNGVINGYEEFKWLMKEEDNASLKDVINQKDSKIAGIWTWSRGGGWGGPYINGTNGKEGNIVIEGGCELWADVNVYVITQWAKDTSHSDRYYALKYAKEELGMNEKDACNFYELLLLSERAVLFGRGTNTDVSKWDVFWTRDQNIEYSRMMYNLKMAEKNHAIDLILDEKEYSVRLWKEIIALAEGFSDDLQIKDYIVTTCKYGYYLFSLYEVMYRANAYALQGGMKTEVEKAIGQYEQLWKEWKFLYKTRKGCPTLYAKEDEFQDLIGYDWNKGFDSAINPIRTLDENGKILPENQVQIADGTGWGLTGEGLN